MFKLVYRDKRRTYDEDSPYPYQPLSIEEKRELMRNLEEKTISEIKHLQTFLLILGFVLGLGSIWVTWQLENLGHHSKVGLITNMISGFGFIILGYRAFSQKLEIRRFKKDGFSVEQALRQKSLLEEVKALKEKMNIREFSKMQLNERKKNAKTKIDLYIQQLEEHYLREDFERFKGRSDVAEIKVTKLESVWDRMLHHSKVLFIMSLPFLVSAIDCYFNEEAPTTQMIFPGVLIFGDIIVELSIYYMRESYEEINTIYSLLPNIVPSVVVKKPHDA